MKDSSRTICKYCIVCSERKTVNKLQAFKFIGSNKYVCKSGDCLKELLKESEDLKKVVLYFAAK